jgi:hypothetical protein
MHFIFICRSFKMFWDRNPASHSYKTCKPLLYVVLNPWERVKTAWYDISRVQYHVWWVATDMLEHRHTGAPSLCAHFRTPWRALSRCMSSPRYSSLLAVTPSEKTYSAWWFASSSNIHTITFLLNNPVGNFVAPGNAHLHIKKLFSFTLGDCTGNTLLHCLWWSSMKKPICYLLHW